MKKSAKKTIKTIPDMTPKQFEKALARHGMELTQDGHHAEGVEVVSVYGFELTGKTRRAKLAQAIAQKEAYDESIAEADEAVVDQRHADDENLESHCAGCGETPQECICNSPVDLVIDPQTGLEIHEADYGDDRYQIADTAIGRKMIYGEDVSAEIEAAEDGTGPAKAKALREAAEANTPVSEAEATFEAEVADGVVKLHEEPVSMQPLVAFTSAAVGELYASLETEHGQEAAAKMLQNAVRDCGKKTVVDGKLGPYTLKLANKIAEADLLSALAARVQEQLHAEAK
jgi:hypothetical protein